MKHKIDSKDFQVSPGEEFKLSRAALKSGRTCDQVDDVSETVAHFSEESWTGAITGAGLAANPGARFALDSPTQKTQDGGGDRMPDMTSIFTGAHIQWVVGPVFDAPVLAHQLQELCRIGLRRRQAGDDPDGFDLLTAVFEFADAVNPSHLRHVWKSHFGRGYLTHLNPTPFDPAVAFIDRLILRGKKLPEGSDRLAFEGYPGCL
jgi:hypothetical protein